MIILSESLTQHPPRVIRLSKSKFLSGLQCHKRLYLEIYAPELTTKPDEATQAVLDMGTEIGEVARRRFPGGRLVTADHRHASDALEQTQLLLLDPTLPAIFEGAFTFDQVLVRVDILERVSAPHVTPAVWRLIEVKSSTRVKDIHLEDLAIQTYVLRGAGLTLAGSCLMHINTQYVYPGGDIDLGHLFAVQNVSAVLMDRLPQIPDRLGEMKAMLAEPSPPHAEPDGHCHQPYDCQFWDHCVKDKPKRWVYHLPGGEQIFQQLAKQGIETIDDIPSGFKLSIIQRRMKDNVEWMDSRLAAALRNVRYPVHHLDFETFMPAIPKFPMTRPYQAIPTQWSNHIESEDGQVQHHEYLSIDPRDTREELAVALLESLGRDGTICVYSGYEGAILERLAQALPALKSEIGRVIGRLWDLFPVIRELYYHPGFEGCFSIKSVLPAVVPTLDYRDLDIQEGGLAAREYHRMVFEEMDWVEKLRIGDALRRYCQRDTLAMLELRRALAHKSAPP